MLRAMIFLTLLIAGSAAIPKQEARALLSRIDGFFYSGGGYVSHGEGAGLTWGWYNHFGDANKTLSDFFSNSVVATTSGGGWFFTDLVYSSEFRDIVTASEKTDFIDRIVVYYRKLIAQLYGVTEEEIKEETENGSWSGMSESDYFKLFRSNKYHSWQDMVMAMHYNYKQEEMLDLENTAWQSTFGLATQFESEYTLHSDLSVIDEKQRSSWHLDIPGFFDVEFKTKGEEPSIDVILPALDYRYASVCSRIKTNKKCKHHNDCMENAYCDTGFKKCVCDHTHTVSNHDKGDEYCMDCLHATSKIWNGSELKSVEKIKVVWNKNWVSKDPEADLDTSKLKEMIKASISDDPKKFSGPSSAALAVAVVDITSSAENKVIKNFGVETAWETAKLTEIFGDEKAPTLDLIDGGGNDNCAITALVSKLQRETVTKAGHLGGDAETIAKDVADLEWNLVGMCAQADLEALIFVPGKQMGKYKQYQLFEYVNRTQEEMKPIFSGDVMTVFAYKLRTVYEPMNGIIPGSIVNVFAFSFPTKPADATKKGGICRNWGNSMISLDSMGMEKCQYNIPGSKKPIQPMMSLLPGRGETREVKFASQFILDDMESFAAALPSLVEEGQEAKEKAAKEEL